MVKSLKSYGLFVDVMEYLFIDGGRVVVLGFCVVVVFSVKKLKGFLVVYW